MTDYRRMVWQYWANRVSWWVVCVCIVAGADEVVDAMRHHFPWWEDAVGVATLVTLVVASFIHKYTKMYRWDL
jgi:hypothetical protein